MLTAQPKTEGWSIVVVGHWNQAIFNPGWIIGRLTEAQEVQLQVAVDNPGLPIRLAFDGLVLQVQPQRLVVNVERCDGELFERAAAVIRKALTELPHTPITAVGVNFLYVVDEPSGCLVDVFRLADLNGLSDQKLHVSTNTITRKLVRDQQVVNLGLILDEAGKVSISLNFHRDLATAAEGEKFLSGGAVTGMHEESRQILQRVYDVSV